MIPAAAVVSQCECGVCLNYDEYRLYTQRWLQCISVNCLYIFCVNICWLIRRPIASENCYVSIHILLIFARDSVIAASKHGASVCCFDFLFTRRKENEILISFWFAHSPVTVHLWEYMSSYNCIQMACKFSQFSSDFQCSIALCVRAWFAKTNTLNK